MCFVPETVNAAAGTVGRSAVGAEQKLTSEIDCFRFCPYTRHSTETTQLWAGLETGFSTSSTWASDEAENGKAGRLSGYLTNRSVFGCSIDYRAPRPRRRSITELDRPPAY